MEQPVSAFLDLAKQLVVLDTASLAFMATFYVFIGADPRLRESSYSLVGATALLTVSILFGTASIGAHLAGCPRGVTPLSIASGVTFVGSWILFFATLIHSFARAFYLRDRRYLKYFKILRLFPRGKVSAYIKELTPRTSKSETLFAIPSGQPDALTEGFSFLLICNCPMPVARKHAGRILMDGLRHGETGNYVCCEISPITALDFVDLSDPALDLRSLVFIDAFTPHYGYYDEVVMAAQKYVREKGPGLVPAFTISGVHSAGNTAWHLARKHQKKAGHRDRRPNRMIYDCISALTPYSSETLVKAFITHSVNSEKLYGMISVYMERPGSPLIDHLRALADGVAEISYTKGEYRLRMVSWKDCKPSELPRTLTL